MPIDDFIYHKRALLGMLPPKRHKEEDQIDLIYGLMKLSLKKKIARTDVRTFAHLLEKARHQESLDGKPKPANLQQQPTSTKPSMEKKSWKHKR